MNQRSVIQRQTRAFQRYFGHDPDRLDMFGENPFPESFEELEELAARYRNWHVNRDTVTTEPPVALELPYKVHTNLSKELVSRVKLLSKMTGDPVEDAMEIAMRARSIPIPIEVFNGAMIYASTIYRGKTQVKTGTLFEEKVNRAISDTGHDVRVEPGRVRQKMKYDKDIYIDGRYRLSAEISFQVTTNSTMERKSNLAIPEGNTVIFIFGGLGWIQRINALERIAAPSSRYAACFGPSAQEMERLKQYIRDLR